MEISHKLKFFVLLVVVLTSCQTHEVIKIDSAIFQKATPSDSLSFYFPSSLNKESRRKNSTYNNFTQRWYSSALYSFKEPILFKKSNIETIYRLLWLRSFHQPVCFSLKEFDNKYYLNTKMLDRQPAFYPYITANNTSSGKVVFDTLQKEDRLAYVIFNETLQINKSEWNNFQALLRKKNFWNLPSLDHSNMSADGAQWILESYKDGKYHYVERQNSESGLKECGLYLLNISSLKIPKDDIY